MGYSDSNTRSLYNIKGASKVYGGTIPASTWKAFMGEAMKGKLTADFPEPTPLAGDVGAGPRRAPLQLAPEEEAAEQFLTVGPPVTLYPQTPFGPNPRGVAVHHPAPAQRDAAAGHHADDPAGLRTPSAGQQGSSGASQSWSAAHPRPC